MQTPSVISFFRTVVLAGVAALSITSGALPVAAQNSVPPTAVQAARMPQFASRLARPANRPAPRMNPRRQGSRGGSPQFGFIYENGPIDGTTDAWTINFGFVASNTFTVANVAGPLGMSFGVWLAPGDVLESVEVSITSNPNGGTSYFDQTVSFAISDCVPNQLSFNTCTATASFFGPALNAGTYWVNLQNAVVSNGDPAYWDENSGAGCESLGCPSQAYENSIGTIPSESFSILGDCPVQEKPAIQAKAADVPRSPTQSYRVIYNFTGTSDGGLPVNGLAIDAAGNLYGTTAFGGPSGEGTAFKLSPGVSGWRFSRLYSFSGVSTGSPSSPLVVGPNGKLFGTGGGNQGYGALFDLSAAAHISPSVFRDWRQTLLYVFTGGNDGAVPGGSLVLDGLGDVYGTTAARGANSGGTLYEFADGGIQVLHAFPAFRGDGAEPLGVINGTDGLYGITKNGGSNRSGTLYTTIGGYQVLHNFTAYNPEGNPISLTMDPAGHLYGTSSFSSFPCGFGGGEVFSLSPPDWNPFNLTSFGPGQQVSSWISTDAQGNVYGTTDSGGQSFQGNVFKLSCCWNYTDLHDFLGGPNDGITPSAPPVVDAQGNIYGTTENGGTYGYGVIWEISP